MAIIKFSGLVTSMVGKLNGSVMQGGSFGTVLRSNCYGRKPQSIASYNARSAFAYISNYGAHLTSAQIADKASAGAAITRPTKGGPATPYNWWAFNQAFNGKLYEIGFAPLGGGFTAPALTPIAALTVTWAGGSTFWDMEEENIIGADERVIIRASAPVKENTSYKKSRMRVVLIGEGSNNGWKIFNSNISAVFGSASFSVPRWFDIQVVDSLTGFFSLRSTFLYVP